MLIRVRMVRRELSEEEGGKKRNKHGETEFAIVSVRIDWRYVEKAGEDLFDCRESLRIRSFRCEFEGWRRSLV